MVDIRIPMSTAPQNSLVEFKVWQKAWGSVSSCKKQDSGLLMTWVFGSFFGVLRLPWPCLAKSAVKTHPSQGDMQLTASGCETESCSSPPQLLTKRQAVKKESKAFSSPGSNGGMSSNGAIEPCFTNSEGRRSEGQPKVNQCAGGFQ